MAIKLERPTVDTYFKYSPQRDGVIVFDFSTTDVTLTQNKNDLVLTFDDGGKIILSGFYTTYTKENMPLFDIKGTIIDGETFFTALGADDIMPAASPSASTPVNGGAFLFTPGVGADLMNGLNALGGLTLAQTAASGELFIPFGGKTGDSESVNTAIQNETDENIPPLDIPVDIPVNLPKKNMVVKVEISTDVNNDGYINKNEIDENDIIKITVTFDGDIEEGDEIIVTNQRGDEIFRGNVTEEMIESGLDIYIEAPTESTDLEITATITDGLGNTTSDSDNAQIDSNAPIIDVEIQSGDDNLLSSAELGTDKNFSVKIDFGLGVVAGDNVSVSFGDQNIIFEVTEEMIEQGFHNVLFEAPIDTDGNVRDGELIVNASITDNAGNKSTATDNAIIEPDTSSPILQGVLDVVLSESHLAGGTEEQSQGASYKQSFTIEAEGDLASITIAGQLVGLSGYSEIIPLEGYSISDVIIIVNDNGNYTVEYTITLDKNITHESPSTAHTQDEVKSLPSFEVSATDSAGNVSSSVTVDVDVLDDVVVLGSVVDTENDFSEPLETLNDFSRDIVTGYVDMSGDFVELGSRVVNYGDVDIFVANSVTITEDGIAVSRTSGKLELGSADGVVEISMKISFDIRGTSNFMQIDGELINVTSYITDSGETIYLIGKISDANGDGKANDKDPEDYAQDDLYARVVFDPNTNTWSMEQYKEYSETIVLEFSATDSDGDSANYKIGVTGTSVGFEPRLASELSESFSMVNTVEPHEIPVTGGEADTSLGNIENNPDGNNGIDSGDDIILLETLSSDSVVSVDGGDRGVDLLLIGENNLSSLKAALENEGSFFNNMEVIMLGDDMDVAKEVQTLLKNDGDYFSALNNGWIQGELHEIGDQNYQEFSNGENTVFVLAPVSFSSMASMNMVNSHSHESMFDYIDDDTDSTPDNYEPRDGVALSHQDNSDYGVSRNGVFDLSITLTDIATGESSVSDLTSTLKQKGITFNVIDNTFSLDSDAWSERESGLFINNEEGAIIDSNLLDIQFTNMNT